MDQSIKLDALRLGVCYYPEHWEESLWQDDLRRMKAHGIQTVRVFEFAWSIVQPGEDTYDFSLFDRFLDLAAAERMQVILCTPTATPPAWLTHAHEEALNRTKDGRLMHHGHRRHYNYNSKAYNAYVKGIVTALAERYGNHPAVIGWQIDNEINCEVSEFYSDADHAAFREYLKERFQTLEAFNDAVGARFWNQSYTDWNEVYLERHTPSGQGNPHLALLGKAFFSYSAIRFVKMQSDLLRQYIGSRFITTNGLFGHLDNHSLTRVALDFITYDSYPNFGYALQAQGSGPDDGLRDRKWSMNLSKARALSLNFGVMEQQAGASGWDYTMMSPMPLPGQIRLWTMQSVAHGADFISYFRWRTAPYGTEIYWHGLNDYDNRPNRRLEEIERIHREFTLLAGVAGSRYEAKAAVLADVLNEWDGERDQWYGPMSRKSELAIFAAAQHSQTPLDFVNVNADLALSTLAKYDVLFYPHAAILTDETAALLREYCAQGGTLIMGARTGYKDRYGRCPMRPMPGSAAALCGVTVREYSFPHPLRPAGLTWDGVRYPVTGFLETLEPDGAEEVAAVYAESGDRAAGMTRKAYPNGGAAYYIGTGFSEELAAALLKSLHADHPFADLVRCPPDVELCVRRKGDERYLFLLNYSDRAQTIELRQRLRDMLTKEKVEGPAQLPPFGVAVLRETLPA